MADIAATDVTYTLQSEARIQSNYSAVFKLEFGDGALTYPANGIPLTKGKLGCPVVIKSLKIFDNSDGDGKAYKYDFENNKIRIYNTMGAHAHDLLIKGGQAASTTNNTAHYATDILGKEAATDATIAGSASATKGGVIATSASTGTEMGNTAVAATVLYVEVFGY